MFLDNLDVVLYKLYHRTYTRMQACKILRLLPEIPDDKNEKMHATIQHTNENKFAWHAAIHVYILYEILSFQSFFECCLQHAF
jgi:hypothetical protein